MSARKYKLHREGQWVEVTAEEFAARKGRGLGDMVASIAQPIARAIDKRLGTDLEHCPGCQQRKEFLNNLGRARDS